MLAFQFYNAPDGTSQYRTPYPEVQIFRVYEGRHGKSAIEKHATERIKKDNNARDYVRRAIATECLVVLQGYPKGQARRQLDALLRFKDK